MKTLGGWLACLALVGCGSDGGGQRFEQHGAGGDTAAGGSSSTGGAGGQGGSVEAQTGGAQSSGGAVGAGGASAATGGAATGGQQAGSGGATPGGGAGAGGAVVVGSGGLVSAGGSDDDAGPIGEDAAAPDAGRPCECSAGACCDGCHFRAYGYLCSKDEVYESRCSQGSIAEQRLCPGIPARIVREHQNVFCTGQVADCSGRAVHSKETSSPCPNGSYCHDDGDGAADAFCSPGCD